MNANELAKLLEVDSWYKLVTREEIATMLRQQQAEIEALKAAKIRAYNNGVEDGRKPDTNNEPVAWMEYIQGEEWEVWFVKPTNEPVAWMETYKGEPNNLDWDKNNLYCEGEFHNVVPLYTHSVKELTDEEIEQVMLEAGYGEVHKFVNPFDFARAILRKASEK